MRFSEMTAQEIWFENDRCTAQTRENCAILSALWFEIEERALWKEWQYESFPSCVDALAERSYTTIMEGVKNYRFFVHEQHMSWDDFLSMMLANGTKKVNTIRRNEEIIKETESAQADFEKLSPEQRRERIREMSRALTPLSVKQAKEVVRQNASQRGIAIENDAVFMQFRLTPDGARLVKEAIEHIKRRARSQYIITDSYALQLWAGEYLQQNGMRQIKKAG